MMHVIVASAVASSVRALPMSMKSILSLWNRDRVSGICPSCKFESAIVEDANYVMPQLVK